VILMSKQLRHETILRLVRQKPIANQQALQQELAKSGLHTTQATLSRDLSELGLVKTGDGYKLPAQITESFHATHSELKRMLREFMREATPANNLVVVKTPAGNANALGIALDNAALPEIVGTVAGDDTILVVTRSAATARSVQKKFLNLVR
jgi:transcriptional regulator of arginine metabolism